MERNVPSGVPYIPNDLRAHTTGKIKVLLCSSFMPTFNPVSRAYIVTGMRKGRIWRGEEGERGKAKTIGGGGYGVGVNF